MRGEWHGSLLILGDPDQFWLRNPIFLSFLKGGKVGPDPLSTPLDPRIGSTLLNGFFIIYSKKAIKIEQIFRLDLTINEP